MTRSRSPSARSRTWRCARSARWPTTCCPRCWREGLKATVNSDDPAHFGGYIDANFAAARSEMNLSWQQIVTLARNSFDACFVTEAERSRLEIRARDPGGGS